jgi:hypothetical protein
MPTTDTLRDRRRAGWFWIHNLVIDHFGAQLGPNGLAVYAALARHADAEGKSWPGIQKLAAETGTSQRTVQRSLRQLEELHLLQVATRTEDNGRTSSNEYALLEPDADATAPVGDIPSPESTLDGSTLTICIEGVTQTPSPRHTVTGEGVTLTEGVTQSPSPPTMEGDQIWAAIQMQMRPRMNRHEYNSFIESAHLIGYSATPAPTYTLAAANPMSALWLHGAERLLTKLITQAHGSPATVQIVTQEDAHGNQADL